MEATVAAASELNVLDLVVKAEAWVWSVEAWVWSAEAWEFEMRALAWHQLTIALTERFGRGWELRAT